MTIASLHIIGESSPTRSETKHKWSDWKKEGGAAAWVTGDPDYGKLALYTGEIIVSDVMDMTNYGSKVFRLTKNVYGEGSGDRQVFKIRGSNTIFDYDDVTPAWETYVCGMQRLWKYVQIQIGPTPTTPKGIFGPFPEAERTSDGWTGYNLRQCIPASDLLADATSLKVMLQGALSYTQITGCENLTGWGGGNCTRSNVAGPEGTNSISMQRTSGAYYYANFTFAAQNWSATRKISFLQQRTGAVKGTGRFYVFTNGSNYAGWDFDLANTDWKRTIIDTTTTPAESVGTINWSSISIIQVTVLSAIAGEYFFVDDIARHGDKNWAFSKCYIGNASTTGDAFDFASTPTQVLFSGNAGATAGPTGLTSDAVTFTLDKTKDLLLSLYFTDGDNDDIPWDHYGEVSSYVMYYKEGADEASTANVTGYDTGVGLLCVRGIYFDETPAWLTGWAHRKRVPLSRPLGHKKNYQMLVGIGYEYEGAGENPDGGGWVGCNSLCQSDFNDIRFTTSDGTTLLDYSTEPVVENVNGHWSPTWVEVDVIGKADNYIYMYYGKADAPAVSNGTNTFLAYSTSSPTGYAAGDIALRAVLNLTDNNDYTGVGLADADESEMILCYYASAASYWQDTKDGWSSNGDFGSADIGYGSMRYYDFYRALSLTPFAGAQIDDGGTPPDLDLTHVPTASLKGVTYGGATINSLAIRQYCWPEPVWGTWEPQEDE